MIILKEITLTNFLSHLKTNIKLEPKQKTLIDGISGSGKSSLVEALVWGVYGRGRTDNKSLVRHGTKKATVSIVLMDDDKKFVITRSITDTNKHSLSVDEEINKKFVPIKATGIKGIQEYLEKDILNSSYLLFVNSIVYLQDNVESFVKQTASVRKNLLLEIINSADYDTYLKRAKVEIQNIKTLVEVNESKIEDRKKSIFDNSVESENLDRYNSDQLLVKKELNTLEAKQRELLKTKDGLLKDVAVLSQYKENFAEVCSSISGNDVSIQDLNSKIVTIQSIDYTKLEADVKKLKSLRVELEYEDAFRDKVMLWNESMNVIKSQAPISRDYETDKISINKEIIEIMGEKVPACPDCGTLYPLFEDNKQNRINTLSEKLAHVTSQFEAYNDQLEKYNDEAKKLGECPKFNAVRISEIKSEISLLSTAENELAKRESSVELVASYSNDINKFTEDTKQLRIKFDDLDKKIKGCGESIGKMDTLEIEITKISALMQSLNSDNAELQGKISLAEVAKSNLEKSEKELKAFSKEVDEQKDDLDCLKLVKDAFGPNGVKSIVIDYVIPQLEEKINNVLSKLSNFRIRLETQKSGLTEGSLLEGLFISIINDIGEEFGYDNFSGGERIKITLAIFEGLASISKFGFRFFDESVIGLDEDTVDSFSDVMLNLQDTISQLFCISHLTQVKDLFDKKLTVVKTNGVSKVV